jgi:thermitase
MKSLKFTMPLLCTISIIGLLQVTGSNIPGDAAIASYKEFNSTLITESYTGQVAGANELTTEPSSYWLTIDDPYFDRQWPLGKINLPALDRFETEETVLVAILDTGIDRNHEDLKGKVVGEINFSDSSTCNDLNGHGTFIAGIIAANINNGAGIAGIAPNARLLNVKIADDNGYCRGSDLAMGIVWAANYGAKVINVSIELDFSFPKLKQAVNYAWEKGAVILAATSNYSIEPVYPAYYENCIAIAATDKYDQDDFSFEYGDWVDIAAPGTTVYSTLPNNRYAFESGTSFAVAHTSGLAALLFSIARDNNLDGRLNDEVRAAIQDGAQQINLNELGLINAGNSIDSINTY